MEYANPLPLLPLLSLLLGKCRRVVSTYIKLRPLSSPSRKPGGVSEAGLLGAGPGTCEVPTNQEKWNYTGSSFLWRFPFCQTFQRMGDLLEKLNADIREWDNWIQVVHLVGYKVPVPCYEYYLMGKVPPLPSMCAVQEGCLSPSPAESSSEMSLCHSIAFQQS